MEKSVNKLGVARKVQRSRIWLQGKRLTAIGFTPGKSYGTVWDAKKKQLRLEATCVKPDEVRTISGKGDMPIIDIVGERVREFFGHSTHVEVTYQPGLITIKASK